MDRARLRRALVRRLVAYPIVALSLVGVWHLRHSIEVLLLTGRWQWPQTVGAVLERSSARVDARYGELARRAGIPWPAPRVALLVFKQEERLELWAAGRDGAFAHLATFPVLGRSGGLGPKRRSDDQQIPEGEYSIDALNPDSRFHLSLRVSYPNDEDRAHSEGADPGGDIYVHGSDASVGCVAIGDEAIEDVFTVVARADADARTILISPVDFRTGASAPPPAEPWIARRYARLAEALKAFPAPGP